MSAATSMCSTPNLYQEELNEETVLDRSNQSLDFIPTIENRFLCVIYLQNNNIQELPDDFFSSLPCLAWLDLRNNKLSDIPKSIKNHQCLTHLLLQNNKISKLPNELGTVLCLKVLQLNGNSLIYPSRDVINAGIDKTLSFLHEKFVDELLLQSPSPSVETLSTSKNNNDNFLGNELRSYNSVLDAKLKTNNPLTISFSEKDLDESENDYYPKVKGKCPRLAKSRQKILPQYCQSAKYLKPVYVCSKNEQEEKIRRSYMKQMALKKRKDLLATQEKVLQNRKSMELLHRWRKNYRMNQISMPREGRTYKYTGKDFPYDTNPEYMTLLTRDDIERDLPDKYRKRLWRRPKPTVPRKNKSDVHLAMKIKELFENLEAIDLNGKEMTPRTEQKVLLNEIQKISEIKQKIMELSSTNMRSLAE